MKKKKDNNKLYWAIAILAIGFFLVTTGVIKLPNFAIVDEDFIYVNDVKLQPENYSIFNGVITFTLNGEVVSYPIGKIWYNLDDSPTVYNDLIEINNLPEMESGVHTIYKHQIDVSINNGTTTARIVNWYLTYSKETIQLSPTSKMICEGLSGTYSESETKCTCPNGDIWYDNSTSKTCGAIQLEPTSSQICAALGGNYTNSKCTCPNGDTWTDSSTSKVCGPVTVTKTEVVTKEIVIEPTFFEKYGIAIIIFGAMGLMIIILSRRK